MSDNPNQFKNDHISVTLKREPGCHVILDIEISPKAVQESYNQAVKTINKEVSIPGFRKGKAPVNMIMDKFQAPIQREWKENVTKNGFYDALDLVKVMPFSKESVKKVNLKNCTKEGASLTVEYETFPETPSIDPTKIQVERAEKREVSEEDIDAEIEQVLSYFAEFEEVAERPAQEGDFVCIDMEVLEDQPHLAFENERLELKKDVMIDWLYPLIIGLKPSEQREGMAPAREGEGSDKKCRITLKRIEKEILPPLDNEFAKKIGLASIEEFRPKVKERLEKQAEQAYKVEMRQRLKAALPKAYIFDLPTNVIQEEIKFRKSAGRKESDDELRLEAEEALRTHFMLRKYAHDHKIEASKDEISREYTHQMTNLPEKYRSFTKDMDGQEIFSRLHLDLLLAKSMDDILERMG